MAALDTEIDHLYQLPLAEFTAARNVLAMRAGERRAFVKALVKPNAAAWAVNQVYWQRREVLNVLIAAANGLRAQQLTTLRGEKADVAAGERAHAEALQVTIDTARSLLESAGEGTSPQVMADIRDTLQALPSEEPIGRLTRPLKPMGFEGLLKLVPALPDKSSRTTPHGTPQADPSTAPPKPSEPASRAKTPIVDEVAARRRQREDAQRAATDAAHRAEADQRRQRAEIEKRLHEIRNVERIRANAVSRSRDELQRAEREEEKRRAALESQHAEVQRLTADLKSAETEARAASERRTGLEKDLEKLTKS